MQRHARTAGHTRSHTTLQALQDIPLAIPTSSLPLASGFSTVSLAVDIYYLGFEEVKTTCLAFLIVRINGSAMERALTPIFSSRTLYAKTDLPAKGLVQKHHVQEEYNHGTNGCEDRGETSIHE